RVCAEHVWIETNASDPFRDEPSILSGGHAPVRTSPTAEHELAGLLAGCPQVVIDSLAGLLGQLKPDGLPGFPLADSRSIGSITVGNEILDLQRNDITGAKLAIDCKVE